MKKEDKQFYIKVNGEEISVSEEIYRAYKNPVWAENKRKQRMVKCRVDKYHRCNKCCEKCGYYLNGGNMTGSVLSIEGNPDLDALAIADPYDLEEAIVLRTTLKVLWEELDEFMPDDGLRIAELLLAHKKQKDIAAILGIPVQTLQYKIRKVNKFVIDYLNKFEIY